MASQARKGVQIDGKDFCCTFSAYYENFPDWNPDPDQVADQPCKHCIKQHPYLRDEAREFLRELRKSASDHIDNPSIDEQFEKLLKELPQPPAGQYECYFRTNKDKEIDRNFTWLDNLLIARAVRNISKDIDYPYIIVCKLVENPMALCDECLEVMRQDVCVKKFIEEEGSKQQKKLFTKDGEVTFACKMLQEPKEKDLAALCEDRFKSDDLESCQRVLEKHHICANDYDYYRMKPGGKEVIDKYFGEDRVRRHKPTGS